MSKINMQVSANGNLDDGSSRVQSHPTQVLPDLEINCYRSFYVAILGVRTLFVVLLAVFILSGIFVHDIVEDMPFPHGKHESKIVSSETSNPRDEGKNPLLPKESRLLSMRKILATTVVASFVYLSIKTVVGWLSMLTVKKKYLHLSLLLECVSLFLCGYLLDPFSGLCAAVIVVIQALCILSLVKIIKKTNITAR